jgi:SAM-dependent methyltransferase
MDPLRRCRHLAAAIDQLVARTDAPAGSAFVVADAEAYEPTGTFDLMVFNESLYYFTEPADAVQRYARSLTPGGHIVVSTHTASRRARAILRQLKHRFATVDETAVSQGANSWVCTVLKPLE